MCVKRKTVASLFKRCCHGNAKMPSVFIVEVHLQLFTV
jgi:hypothetical protein